MSKVNPQSQNQIPTSGNRCGGILPRRQIAGPVSHRPMAPGLVAAGIQEVLEPDQVAACHDLVVGVLSAAADPGKAQDVVGDDASQAVAENNDSGVVTQVVQPIQ